MITFSETWLDDIIHEMNKVYVPTIKNKKRFNVYYGGAGSGKSRHIVKMLILLQLKFKFNILCVRKTYKSHKNSTFKAFQWAIDDMGVSEIYKKTTTPLMYRTLEENTIDFLGVDDPEKLKSIEGYDLIWIEEATELEYEDYKQLNLRLRGKGKRKQFVISFNPIDENHWLKSELFDKEREDTDILQTTYRDNKYLDEEYIRMLEEEVDDYWKSVYTDGNWGTLTDLIFDQRKIRVKNITTSMSDYDYIFSGIDWGFTHIMAFTIVGINKEEPNNIYIIKEITMKEVTTNEFLNEIKSEVPEWRKLHILADCAEPDRIEEARRMGFNIDPVDKSKGSLGYGIDYMRRKFIIIHPDCYQIQKEVKSYKYKKINGHVTSEPLRKDDDTIDSVRYALREYSKEEKTIKNYKKDDFVKKLNKIEELFAKNTIF